MRAILTLIAVLLATAAPLSAQGLGDYPVTWTVRAEPSAVAPGRTLQVVFTAEVGEGWRMYAMGSEVGRALTVRFGDLPAGLEAIGPPVQDQPKEAFDATVNLPYPYFDGTARVAQPFRVTEEAASGAATLEGTLSFMVCNDDVCLPPRQEPFAVPVRVEGGQAAAPQPLAEPQQPEEAAVAEATTLGADTTLLAVAPSGTDEAPAAVEPLAVSTVPAGQWGGLWAFLIAAAGAGLIALLTPCVYPMIPLTVSYFLHHAGDRRRATRMAAAYGLSIVGIFTGLGLAMALVVGAAGPQLIAANPWVNLFLGGVLIVFGFSLLGFYELRLPASVLNYFNQQSQERSGYVGVLFMGFTLTLVSFSCTAPFVGGLLAQAVQSDWGYPLLGMVVFSGVFALPFVLFALFPNALARLPRSGGWMVAMKGTLGFIEVVAALKFLSNADLVWGLGLLPRPLAIAFAIVLFTLAGTFLLGRLPLKTPTAEAQALPQPIGAFRLLGSLAFFAFALYLVPGLLGSPLGAFDAFLPPRQMTDVSLAAALPARSDAPSGEIPWRQSREEAFAEAAATGRPVLIDFTGYTCTNCRYMEANVLSRPTIAQRIREGFVPLQLWTDDATLGPDLQRYQLQLTGRLALPTYAVVAPDGALVHQLSGIASESDYAAFLEAGAAAFGSDQLAMR